MWENLKSILKGNDKCIIIEDGKPSYVILAFSEYQHLQEIKNNDNLEESSINGEFQKVGERGDESHASPINIEDLPF